MAYYDKEHRDKIDCFNDMWSKLDDIEELAKTYQIADIAQDNNLKLLQTLVLFDFDNQPVERGAMLLIDTVMLGSLKRLI